MSQWRLFRRIRFWPFFCTQFLGAFNDNVFKNALIILVAYKSLSVAGLSAAQVVPLCAGIFILPFFLFSAPAGQLADKVSKTTLIRKVKLMEIAIMALATVGFVTTDLPLLLVVLFLMGLQSTLFGPAKYSVLPDLLGEEELVGGNALVEMGTFVAILLGTMGGGFLIAAGEAGEMALSATVLVVAVAGWMVSRFIPVTPACNPSLSLSLNPITPTIQTFAATRSNRAVFLSVLGISWFWFLGASILTILPNYAKTVLLADELVVTLLLGLFCIGISVGSLLCERLSDGRLELGLVPVGSFGMTLFALDVFLAGNPDHVGDASGVLLSPLQYLESPASWRVCVDFALLAVFGGLYTVPLYTMIQQRSEAAIRSRVIAGNNIFNALFMVASSAFLLLWTSAGLTLPQVFLVLALLNAAVALFIYTVIPEFLLRLVVWVIAKVMYRLRIVGRHNIPAEGPAVLVCNHQSFVDWLIVASAVRQPVRFVMYHTYFRLPLVGFLFRDAKVIPIAPAHEDESTLHAAYDRIAAELASNEIVCIFPEGKLTRDGRMNVFRRGIERVIERTPVPVVPIAINGMWGSIFSRFASGSQRRPLRGLRNRVRLTIGEPIAPEQVTADALAMRVSELGEFDLPESPVAPAVAAES